MIYDINLSNDFQKKYYIYKTTTQITNDTMLIVHN